MKILTFLCLILLFSKCNIHSDAEIDYTLTIKNKTLKNIQIITYQYGSFTYREHFKTINIPSNTDYNEYFTFFSSRWGSDMSKNALLYNTDSIVIIYEKEKFKYFTCLERPGDSTNCNELRNPLMFKSSNTIEYIITEEDYQNAEECDGRCE